MNKFLSDSTLHKTIRERDDLTELQKNALHRKKHAEETFDNWLYNILDEEERSEARDILIAEGLVKD